MTLHLLKNPVSQATLALLSAQTAAPIVVLLSADVPPPALSHGTVYRLTEQSDSQNTAAISYDRLVSMLFEADRIITW